MDATLDAEMDLFADTMVSASGQDEIFASVLLVGPRRLPKGTDPPLPERALCVLVSAGDGAEQARLARLLVYVTEPRMALVAMEGWTIKQGVPKDDPDYRRMLRGEVSPSQLPPAKRGEMLIIYGETQEGTMAHRFWIIDTPATGSRALRRMDDPTEVSSRFSPLFLVDAALRDGPTANLDPRWARELAHKAVGAFLTGDERAGKTSASHEQIVANLLRGVRLVEARRN